MIDAGHNMQVDYDDRSPNDCAASISDADYDLTLECPDAIKAQSHPRHPFLIIQARLVACLCPLPHLTRIGKKVRIHNIEQCLFPQRRLCSVQVGFGVYDCPVSDLPIHIASLIT